MSYKYLRTEEEVKARREIVKTSRAMLDGTLSFLEGTAIINRLKGRIDGVDFDDPDFIVFSGIGSISDHLPLGKQKALWSSDALMQLKSECSEMENRARLLGSAACQNIVARFGDE